MFMASDGQTADEMKFAGAQHNLQADYVSRNCRYCCSFCHQQLNNNKRQRWPLVCAAFHLGPSGSTCNLQATNGHTAY